MRLFKKILGVSAAFLVVFSGLWLVVANTQLLTINLLFVSTPALNAGVVVLVSFAVGCGVGLLAGFNLFSVFKLNMRLHLLKREVRQLQDALGKDRH